jgi:hypothetical protein
VDCIGDDLTTNEWRCLMQFLSEGTAPRSYNHLLGGSGYDGSLRALDFDVQQDALLCEELKLLYVAITRARRQVFVFESNIQKRAPIFHFLLAHSHAQVGLTPPFTNCYDNNPLTLFPFQVATIAQVSKRAAGTVAMTGGRTGNKSEARQWKQQGLRLDKVGRYEAASHFYAQAGEVRLEHRAQGDALLQLALRCTAREEQRRLYLDAAVCFVRADDVRAAVCFHNAGEKQVHLFSFFICQHHAMHDENKTVHIDFSPLSLPTGYQRCSD